MNRMKRNYELINIMSQGLLWKQEGLALRNQELTWRAPKDDKKLLWNIFLKQEIEKGQICQR